MSLDTFQIVVLIGLLTQFIIFPVLGYREYKKHKADPFYKNWNKQQDDYQKRVKLWEERSKEPPTLPKDLDNNLGDK